MAIKGKKRSRNRGSQGVRRPAAAPRPAAGGGRRSSHWYDSPINIGVVVIFGLVAIGILIALIVDIRGRASERGDRKEVLEAYTESVRAPLELATSPATQMAGLITVPTGDALDSLKDDVEGWVTELQSAQTQLAQAQSDVSTTGVNQLLNEAIALYVSAANTFATLPDISDKDARQAVFTQAATVRDTASAVFQSALTVLEQLREDVDLGSSGLRAPSTVVPQTETPTEAEDEAGGDAEGEDAEGGGAEQEGDAEGGGGGG